MSKNDSKESADILRLFKNLTLVQQKIFLNYGLRVVKYMFEKDYIRAVEVVPNGAVVQGVNSFGRWQAIDENQQKRYGYFPTNNEWSQTTQYNGGGDVDSLDDLQKVYDHFKLKDSKLEDLTFVHANFIEFTRKKIMEEQAQAK